MKTLLVADDEPANIALIKMVVEDSGVDVRLVTAADGEQAVASARATAPDLILMDLKMRVLDGWEATRRLKADPATRAIPILGLSAHAMAGDREKALAAGCDVVLHCNGRLLRLRQQTSVPTSSTRNGCAPAG